MVKTYQRRHRENNTAEERELGRIETCAEYGSDTCHEENGQKDNSVMKDGIRPKTGILVAEDKWWERGVSGAGKTKERIEEVAGSLECASSSRLIRLLQGMNMQDFLALGTWETQK